MNFKKIIPYIAIAIALVSLYLNWQQLQQKKKCQCEEAAGIGPIE